MSDYFRSLCSGKRSLHLKGFVLGSNVTAVSWLRDGNETTHCDLICMRWLIFVVFKPGFLLVTKGHAHGSVCGLCNGQKDCHTSC